MIYWTFCRNRVASRGTSAIVAAACACTFTLVRITGLLLRPWQHFTKTVADHSVRSAVCCVEITIIPALILEVGAVCDVTRERGAAFPTIDLRLKCLITFFGL